MNEPTASRAKFVLPRPVQKSFARRNDRTALLFLCGHFSLIGLTGYGIYLATGTWWLVPAMIAHGVVLAFLFAPLHELSHGTAFRTRWLNEAAFRLIAFVYTSAPVFFRYVHSAHHTYTQIRGKDPDIILLAPASWGDYFYYVSGIPFWRRNAAWLVSHAMGRISDAESWFIPRDELPRIYREARVMLLLYGVIVIAAIAMSSWAPLVYWVIPRLVGEPVMRWMRVAEHVGCEYSADPRRNTRTTRPSLLLGALFWNMSYHAEHHLCPAVPFHALPKLHREYGHELHPVGSGYIAVHRGILGNVLGHTFARLPTPGSDGAIAK